MIQDLDRLRTCHQWPAAVSAARRGAARLPTALAIALVAGTVAIAGGATNATGLPDPSPAAEPSRTDRAATSGRAEPAPVFPLAVRPGERYLVDAAGKPFFIHGDTAWSLIADLTREEVAQYIRSPGLPY